MPPLSRSLLRAVEEYVIFLDEQKHVQQVLDRVYASARRLEEAVWTQSVKEITTEERVLQQEEKKLHFQVHEVERALHRYQQSLQKVVSPTKRSQTIALYGKKFQIYKRKNRWEISAP